MVDVNLRREKGKDYIEIGCFETDADLRYHDEIHGDVFTQVNRTLEILQAKYLKAVISYDGVQRVETWPVPSTALREALLNGVSHKDYSSNVPIQISVYPDKLMLWNPGQLPADWIITHLLGNHASQPFNPDIANVFFRAGMVESWGRGIERIMQACRDARVPTPELRYEQTGLWVIFPFLSPNRVGEKVGEKLTANQKKILLQLSQNANLSARELAELVGISSRKIEQNIAKLKKLGRLRRIGPAKGGYWEVME